MEYLTDHRASIRQDPRQLLPSAKSIICVGKLYNETNPKSIECVVPYSGWVSRYAWGKDYHDVLRAGMVQLTERLRQAAGPFESRICVDTAPILERSYARLSGLGWIGKNTCLINQQQGSWFFLGELLISLDLEPDQPPPDRCGTCTRCIDACPTQAIVPTGANFTLDARRCISYFTIELKEMLIPDKMKGKFENRFFGCDVCQDVCPWNRFSAQTKEPLFAPIPQILDFSKHDWEDLTEESFKKIFRNSPLLRSKFAGIKRNLKFISEH